LEEVEGVGRTLRALIHDLFCVSTYFEWLDFGETYHGRDAITIGPSHGYTSATCLTAFPILETYCRAIYPIRQCVGRERAHATIEVPAIEGRFPG
jgi:hypothetical protein